MNQERFGGSLVAPYQTPGEPPQNTQPVIAPEDRRFGGSLVAPYFGASTPEPAPEPVVPVPVVPQEPVIVEDISDEPVVEEDISVEPVAEAGTDLSELPDDENLPDVDDEHRPEWSKPFQNKGKRRR